MSARIAISPISLYFGRIRILNPGGKRLSARAGESIYWQGANCLAPFAWGEFFSGLLCLANKLACDLELRRL